MEALFIVPIILMLLTPVFFAIISPTTGRFPLKPADFQRVLIQETDVKILWTRGWGGGYWYFSSVRGNPIYTRSIKQLEFPDSCELIPFKLSMCNL